MGAAIKLSALFLCPRSGRCVGTAEQNRASGQRGQRTGIPFAAGRAMGQVSSPSVSCSDRREKCSLRCLRARRVGGWGRKGNWELGSRDLGCLWSEKIRNQAWILKIQSQINAIHTLYPASPTGVSSLTSPGTHNAPSRTKSLALLLRSMTDPDRSLSERQSQTGDRSVASREPGLSSFAGVEVSDAEGRFSTLLAPQPHPTLASFQNVFTSLLYPELPILF